MILTKGLIQADIIAAKQAIEYFETNKNRNIKSVAAYHLQQAAEKLDCVNSFSQIHFSARQPAVTRPAYETVCRLPVSVPCSYSAFRPKWSPLHVAAWHRPASGRCFHPETRQWPASVV